MTGNEGVTVIGVCRTIGVEPYPEMTWAVGAAVRDEYVRRYGDLPPKELRPKTYEGKGSHCFAIYPESMRGYIESAIMTHKVEAARQFSFEFEVTQ